MTKQIAIQAAENVELFDPEGRKHHPINGVFSNLSKGIYILRGKAGVKKIFINQ